MKLEPNQFSMLFWLLFGLVFAGLSCTVGLLRLVTRLDEILAELRMIKSLIGQVAAHRPQPHE
jgi:hypothetical protein